MVPSSLHDALAAAIELVDVSTPELRRASLAELIRVACAQYMTAASTLSTTARRCARLIRAFPRLRSASIVVRRSSWATNSGCARS